MTTSEPTTALIVEKLRQVAKVWAKQKIIDDRDILFLADRLESQEQTIAALTARAEQAERERDAAIDLTAIRIMRYVFENNIEIDEYNSPCVLCEHENSNHGKCVSCYSTEGFELRNDLRGQPQDGEGK